MSSGVGRASRASGIQIFWSKNSGGRKVRAYTEANLQSIEKIGESGYGYGLYNLRLGESMAFKDACPELERVGWARVTVELAHFGEQHLIS